MLSLQTINSPSKGTFSILSRKVADDQIKQKIENGSIEAIGLIQGQLAEIIVAGDIAQKASNVEITEITGVCPQHIVMIGVFGDTASVSEALKAVRNWVKNGCNQDLKS